MRSPYVGIKANNFPTPLMKLLTMTSCTFHVSDMPLASDSLDTIHLPIAAPKDKR